MKIKSTRTTLIIKNLIIHGYERKNARNNDNAGRRRTTVGGRLSVVLTTVLTVMAGGRRRVGYADHGNSAVQRPQRRDDLPRRPVAPPERVRRGQTLRPRRTLPLHYITL